jgi:hypothetical protein
MSDYNAKGETAWDYWHSSWADKESSDKFWAQNREDDIRRETFNQNLALANARSSGSGSARSGSGGGGGSTGWGNSSTVPGGTYGYGSNLFGRYDADTAVPSGNTGFNSSDSMNMLNNIRDANYGMSAPTYAAIPTFTAPEVDKYGYKAYSNQYAQPYNRELSRAIQKAVLTSYGKPAPLARQEVASALEKGATGYSNIMGKATEYGQKQYNEDYSKLYQTALTNFNANVNSIMSQNSMAAQRQNQLANTVMNSFTR